MSRYWLLTSVLCGALPAAACSANADSKASSSSHSGAGGSTQLGSLPSAASEVAPPLLPSGPGSGLSDPAEVCLPAGAFAYLGQLRCSDGTIPSVAGRVNVGPRNDPPDDLAVSIWTKMGDPMQPIGATEVDYHIVDRFLMNCSGSQSVVFLDVYHCVQ
jgi:hypothetical protein